MSRATYGAARHRKKVRVFKAAKGFRGAPGKRWRLAKEMVMRSRATAYVGRRLRKRDFRALWIVRLSAACRTRGISYSRFIFAINELDIQLNRKMMSEIAIHSPEDFDAIVELAKNHLPKSVAA